MAADNDSSAALLGRDAGHAPPPRLMPGWWLMTIGLWNLPNNLCWTSLTMILFPADVAALVGPVQKGVYLGFAASVGGMMPLFGLPIAGALADYTAAHMPWLTRRHYHVGGQLVVLASIAAMLAIGGRVIQTPRSIIN